MLQLFKHSLASTLAILLVGTAGLAHATKLEDLPHDPEKFSYYRLGEHVPPKAGYPNYLNPRTVIHDSIGLPIEVDPKRGKHMYCNPQLYNLKPYDCFLTTKNPRSNNSVNLAFPWTSTFCERRWSSSQHTRACGKNEPPAHQGTDCRPPTSEGNVHWAIAVEDGIVATKPTKGAAGWNVKLVGDASDILWTYRHGNEPVVRKHQRLKKGERIMKISRQCPTHLHLESKRNRFHMDNLPSLILAYQRALGVTPTPLIGRELAFDPRFEIASGCGNAEKYESIGTEEKYTFSSLWCHGGSIMGQVRDGNDITFVYYKPHPDMRESALRDPVLLHGATANGELNGQSIWYNRNCGDRRFAVAGKNTSPDKFIQVSGERLVFHSSDCHKTRKKRETLLFHYMRDFAPQSDPQDDDDVADDTTPVPTPGDDSVNINYWIHNGSDMKLTVRGKSRMFTYERPRPGLKGLVKKGTVLFEGTKYEGGYRGKAYWFASGCAPTSYDVRGPVEQSGTRIVLTGKRPKLASDCTVEGTSDDRLVFTFRSQTPPPAPEQNADEQSGPVSSIAPVCTRAHCVDRAPFFKAYNRFGTPIGTTAAARTRISSRSKLTRCSHCSIFGKRTHHSRTRIQTIAMPVGWPISSQLFIGRVTRTSTRSGNAPVKPTRVLWPAASASGRKAWHSPTIAATSRPGTPTMVVVKRS